MEEYEVSSQSETDSDCDDGEEELTELRRTSMDSDFLSETTELKVRRTSDEGRRQSVGGIAAPTR